MALLAVAAPWVILAALFGIFYGAMFHVLFGKTIVDLPRAVGFGLGGSLGGGFVGVMIPPAILAIGDTNLISVALGAAGALAIGRLFRFC